MEKEFIIKQELKDNQYAYISKTEVNVSRETFCFEVGITTIMDFRNREDKVPFYTTDVIKKTESIEKPLLRSLEKFKELLRKEDSIVATKSLGCSRCHVEYINQYIDYYDLAQGFGFEPETKKPLTA